MSAVQLVKVSDTETEIFAGGGEVAYRVTVDGRWVGWVGDQRQWRGHRFGGREWWACWREDGDTAARWNSFSNDAAYKTRAASVASLLARIEAAPVVSS